MKLIMTLLTGLLLVSVVAALSPQTVVADSGDPYAANSELPKPVAMNVKNYEVTPKVFYEAAYRALVKRGWKVETNELTRLVGNRRSGDEVYKAEIRFANDVITIGYVQGFHNPFKRNWLKNLAEDIKLEITPLKRKVQVVPPAPAAGQ